MDTPPWPEHVPERVLEKEYEPSRHLADAPTGASDAVVGVVSGIVAAAVVGGTTKTGRVVVVDGDVVLVAATKGKVDGTTTTGFKESTSQAVPSLFESKLLYFL